MLSVGFTLGITRLSITFPPSDPNSTGCLREDSDSMKKPFSELSLLSLSDEYSKISVELV